jgi:hypothetical protein
MPNGLNEAISGGLGGINQVIDAVGQKQRESSLNDLFHTGIKSLQGQMTKQPDTYDTQGQLENIGQYQQEQLDPQTGLNSLYNSIAKIIPYGEQGKPYIGMLQNIYNSQQKETPKYQIVNDKIGYIDKNGSFVATGDAPQKQKPEKDLKSNNWEVNTDESGNPYYGEWVNNKETGQPEFVKRADLTPEEKRQYDVSVSRDNKTDQFAPHTGIHRGGKIGSNFSTGEKKDATRFDKLDNFNERIRGGEQLTDKETEDYNTLRMGLGKKYGLNDTQLAQTIDKINSVTNKKQKEKLFNDLEKGDYHNATDNTSQAQIEYDRGRIGEWKTYLDQSNSANDGSYEGNKQAFLKELSDFYDRGSITLKEFNDLKKSYF